MLGDCLPSVLFRGTEAAMLPANDDNDVLVRCGRALGGDCEDHVERVKAKALAHIDRLVRSRLHRAGRRCWHLQGVVTSDTVLALIEASSRQSLPEDSHLSAFVAGIVRHKVSNVKRRERMPTLSDCGIDIACSQGRGSDAEDPAEIAEQSARTSWLESAMNELSDRDRDVIVRRHFCGQTWSELADALRVTVSTAKKRLGRALPRLKTALLATVGAGSHTPRRGFTLPENT
jgi:RNA polymerase sigma factor (sigma-70 family)